MHVHCHAQAVWDYRCSVPEFTDMRGFESLLWSVRLQGSLHVTQLPRILSLTPAAFSTWPRPRWFPRQVVFVVEHGGASLGLSLLVAWVACFGSAAIRHTLGAVLSATRPTTMAKGNKPSPPNKVAPNKVAPNKVAAGGVQGLAVGLRAALVPDRLVRGNTWLLPFFLCTACLWLEKALSV